MNTKMKTIFKMLNVMPYEQFKLQIDKTKKRCCKGLFYIDENLSVINLDTHSEDAFIIADILANDVKIVKLPQDQYKYENTKYQIISKALMNDISATRTNRKYNAEWYNPEINAIVGVYDKYDSIKGAGTYHRTNFYIKDYGIDWVDCSEVEVATNE